MVLPVLIISKDKDFSSVVAEQVKQELALGCIIAENGEAAGASLVITSEEGKGYDCPVIAVKHAPVRLRELLAEAESLLQKSAADAIDLGRGYGLHLRQKQLVHNGKAVDLTDKEVQLLAALREAGNRGVGKEQLLKDVWGIEAALNTHTLETHIYRLRGKCRELGDEEMIMATDSGYGLK